MDAADLQLQQYSVCVCAGGNGSVRCRVLSRKLDEKDICGTRVLSVDGCGKFHHLQPVGQHLLPGYR